MAPLAVYPAGLVHDQLAKSSGYRTDPLPPVRRGLVVTDVEATGTPILLVHGSNGQPISVHGRPPDAAQGAGPASCTPVNYSQRTGGSAAVHTLVTLGSPHGGSPAAPLLPTPSTCQLRPGSELLAEPAGPACGCPTRFLVAWSRMNRMTRRSATPGRPPARQVEGDGAA